MRKLSTFSIALASILLVTASITSTAEPDVECVDWFKQSKITTGKKDCEMSCGTLMVDMGTFMCPDQCEDLCRFKAEDSSISKFIFYPGLTAAEKNLVAKSPKDAITVYKQKRIAESSTLLNFPDQSLNDESDAFRHFLWAALLTKELGKTRAKEFLDAHEADPDEPDIERKMDLNNNNRGQAAAETLIKEKQWSQKTVEATALTELRSKSLQVLKPALPIPKEPK